MYKLLLCWRYLRTRYIALASIVSVMLGVATMIVVNAVMAGFKDQMQNRIRGVLSDLTFEARSLDGMPDAGWHIEKIRGVAGQYIEAMTPTVVVPGLMYFRYGSNWITRDVIVIGIDPDTQAGVSDFATYLNNEQNRRQFSFGLREDGYDARDHQSGPEALLRPQMRDAGWTYRRSMAETRALEERILRNGRNPAGNQRTESRDALQGSSRHTPRAVADGTRSVPATVLAAHEGPLPPPVTRQAFEVEVAEEGSRAPLPSEAPPAPPGEDPFARRPAPETEGPKFDPTRQQHTGAVLGIAMLSARTAAGDERFLAVPGDDVKLTFPTVGMPPKAVSDDFTVVDLYESKMHEYDSKFVFLPIRKLQELRGMIDPSTNVGLVNSIQIKLKPGVDGDKVRDLLREKFAPELYGVYTWRDKQGPLLAAVEMETAILNVLLFLIIAVAGFGILAIFFTIVVEKTRDIGILKSLGAPARGVMGIFLSYGLSLGLVGSGVGLVLGLLFVRSINQIADGLGYLTGRPVFDPTVYYFYRIPTIVQPWTLFWILSGAVGIAVAASILPAWRAARLHPVEALRYE